MKHEWHGEEREKKSSGFGWKKYVEDYNRDENGKVTYTGDYYCFYADKKLVARVKKAYCILAAAMAVLFIAAGFNEYVSSRILYVAMPYVACVFPICFLIMDAVRIYRAPERMTRKQYAESVTQQKMASLILLLFSLIATAGGIVFLIQNSGILYFWNEVVFTACCAGMLILAAVWIWLSSKIPSGIENSEKGKK